ncbi:MAG TPA: GT4 family glycosyltransferase PelF [Gammaproteobacteria bacterium]|nr:GT4 family glycosyltransferase PelF [Gammaproteobacteria bacterium]
MNLKHRTASQVDILLLLEGTYPYVSGGVATWVHQLIKLFPEYTFGVIFIGGQRKDYGDLRYDLPDNLIHLESHYLFETEKPALTEKKCPVDAHAFGQLTCLHQQFANAGEKDYLSMLSCIDQHFSQKDHVTLNDVLHSRESWDYITQAYQEKASQTSFLNFFWSIRNMHQPLWKLFELFPHLPKAKLLHSASTGYAGFLGALVKEKTKTPFVVTEHGIYIKERRIDLMYPAWLDNSYFTNARDFRTHNDTTNRWTHFFEILGKFCYASAETIISLFPAYQQSQIAYGANPEKALIIPNGVLVNETLITPKKTPNQDAPIIACIGRVVSIKDVKNFIRSMLFILKQFPKATAWIIGETTEDKQYYQECVELITVLDLKSNVLFKGKQNVAEILKSIDVVVISSISEGLPLVVLESFAAGVPVVSTDVGACRELIDGANAADQALGSAGAVVDISDSAALGQGVTSLLSDPARWQAAQETALKRVNAYYSLTHFRDNYAKVYQQGLSSWQA